MFTNCALTTKPCASIFNMTTRVVVTAAVVNAAPFDSKYPYIACTVHANRSEVDME
jgi:hypothetical protein